MKQLIFAPIAFLCLSASSPASEPLPAQISKCAGIVVDDERLKCFDEIATSQTAAAPEADEAPTSEANGDPSSVFYTPVKPEPRDNWSVYQKKNPLDDSKVVQLTTLSSEPMHDRFRARDRASLVFRCESNTTNAYIVFGGLFMSSNSGHGRVNYRVDDRKPARTNMGESNDNTALGLWSGGRAIPFIKGLMGASKLYVEATPFSESRVSMTFDISGLDEAIKPLREACHW
ncbi:type VI secretion system-associated protein TagO [Thioclava sp. NG1]|uniref:type VI secretion system-associated protein TagO n=1 Tax=Thioclava sp. NG1 TaxID=2182426 RepID=UPI0013049F9D|nr:type VI secretion system-associated protein TagO [Thioclava sp. NG1]